MDRRLKKGRYYYSRLRRLVKVISDDEDVGGEMYARVDTLYLITGRRIMSELIKQDSPIAKGCTEVDERYFDKAMKAYSVYCSTLRAIERQIIDNINQQL